MLKSMCCHALCLTRWRTHHESTHTHPHTLKSSPLLCLSSLISIHSEQLDKQSALKLIQRLETDVQSNPKQAGAVPGGDVGGLAVEDSLFEVVPPADSDMLDHGLESSLDLNAQGGVEPSLEYELTRRRVQSNIAEIWNYFSAELGKIRKAVGNSGNGNADLEESIQQVLLQGAEHKRSLLSDMEQLRRVDGYEAWRQKEANDLSDLVQRRLHYLQNPSDCSQARKLVCKLNKVTQETRIISFSSSLYSSNSFLHLLALCFLLKSFNELLFLFSFSVFVNVSLVLSFMFYFS